MCMFDTFGEEYSNESHEEHTLLPIQIQPLFLNDFIVRCNK